jgi:hypothetical protein
MQPVRVGDHFSGWTRETAEGGYCSEFSFVSPELFVFATFS